MNTGGIGQSTPAKEDERLITGRGRSSTTSLRRASSTWPSSGLPTLGRGIVSIDTAAARELPGVTVFLADDLPVWLSPYPPRARIARTLCPPGHAALAVALARAKCATSASRSCVTVPIHTRPPTRPS